MKDTHLVSGGLAEVWSAEASHPALQSAPGRGQPHVAQSITALSWGEAGKRMPGAGVVTV